MPGRAERPGTSAWATSRHELPVLPPFRLDLTVAALRRLATNPVDVLTPAGEYRRALGPGALGALHAPGGGGDSTAGARAGLVILHVTQPRPDALAVTIRGEARAQEPALARVRRLLGTDRDLSAFHRAAARIPWLAPLAQHLRGLKPPRYPSLWEACANAIVFQQVSVHAATTIMRRLVTELGERVEDGDVALRVFPEIEAFLAADDALLRATGLSAAKVVGLRRAGEAIASGVVSETELEACDSAEAARRLRTIKGIGPWTATVILLRGLGRLDVFPANDSGVARSLGFVAGSAGVDSAAALDALGDQRGMLYFSLLLARLEARGEIGRPTTFPGG